ncbi:Tll0287-like domain-containing protein [Cecembia rubra]|uniref:Uncharacterized protein DUF3365 n=2 Tax=Cecembia rubra TaxID=1485585 RepID=A0A2P8E0F1_9BACT|nr:DUF3365 domain-containing protein [Cecembia rubra]PSL02929.1 uncharacterized protein DUF3365 [Cecembia rubra]
MIKKIAIILSFFVFGGCSSNDRVSREVFEEVNKSMEIKKVNEADLIKEALKWGNEISQEAQEQLIAALQNAIAEKGVPGAIEFCNEQAFPILEEMSTKYNVNIRRASNDYRNPKDKPLDYEEMILDAFEYNLENELPVEPNIQKIEGGEVLHYAKVIQIPGALCLNCHGNPETEISPDTREKLKALYPEDKAIGHKIGDLRGIWSIRIPRKEVVKRM